MKSNASASDLITFEKGKKTESNPEAIAEKSTAPEITMETSVRKRTTVVETPFTNKSPVPEETIRNRITVVEAPVVAKEPTILKETAPTEDAATASAEGLEQTIKRPPPQLQDSRSEDDDVIVVRKDELMATIKTPGISIRPYLVMSRNEYSSKFVDNIRMKDLTIGWKSQRILPLFVQH